MRLWSSKILELELAGGQLSEREKVKYLLLPALFTVFIGGPLALIAPRYGLHPPRYDALVALINGLLMVAVTFFGIRKAYRINQRIDGLDFIERFTVLALPVNIRFTVAALPLLIVLIVVFHRLDSRLLGGLHRIFPLYRLVFPVATLWFYQMLSASFSRFGQHRRRAGTPSP